MASSLNLVIGGVATTYLTKHLGLPNDPVTTMIGTTLISSLISEIETSTRTLNLPINFFEIKRKLGLSYYTVIIDLESIYYQKIITYLISNYKKIPSIYCILSFMDHIFLMWLLIHPLQLLSTA
jgi:hypothetical protein